MLDQTFPACQVWDPVLGWQDWIPPTAEDFTVVPPHMISELPGFREYYGVHVTPIGEDDDAYLTLGHAEPRCSLAAAMRWARVNYRQRYRDWQWLRVERLWAVFSALVDDPRDWELEYVSAGIADAVPVTLVTGLEGLESFVQPSRCPRCGRMSTTGRRMNRERWPVGSTGLAHRCSCSDWCVWPAERQTTTA